MTRSAALLRSPATDVRAPAISALLGRSPVIQRSCAACGGGKSEEGRCPACESMQGLDAVQAKLTIGAPDDPLEKEADEVADKVMRMPAGSAAAAIGDPEDRGGPLRRKAAGAAAAAAPTPAFADALGARSGGAPLSADARGFFEPRFARDLGHVRIHDDSSAGSLARGIGARAFTHGADIYFAAGQYDPVSEAGRRLLAHELTHTFQQQASNAPRVVQRKLLFGNWFETCHKTWASRKFEVKSGHVTVRSNARVREDTIIGCSDDVTYPMGLTRVVDWWLDDDYGTCDFFLGKPDTITWPQVAPGTYQLEITTGNTNPGCCLTGDMQVFDEVATSGGVCQRGPDLAREMLHGALSAAGMIPFLGIIADVIDALVYVIDGDWESAGIAAVAIVPVFGDGASVFMKGVKVTRKAVLELGEKGIAEGIQKARQSSNVLEFAPNVGSKVKSPKFKDRTQPGKNGSGTTTLTKKTTTTKPGTTKGNTDLRDMPSEAAEQYFTKPMGDPYQGTPKQPPYKSFSELVNALNWTATATQLADKVEPKKQTEPKTKTKLDSEEDVEAPVFEKAEPCKLPPGMQVHLVLPPQKSVHANYYRTWLPGGLLQHRITRPDRDTRQTDNWKEMMGDGTDGYMSIWVRLQAAEIGLCERQIVRPKWTREGLWPDTHVDHIIEYQVAPIGRENLVDDVANYELLDASSNKSAGPKLTQNIYKERIRLIKATNDPSFATCDLTFTVVDESPRGPAGRWSFQQVADGAHMDAFDKLGLEVKDVCPEKKATPKKQKPNLGTKQKPGKKKK